MKNKPTKKKSLLSKIIGCLIIVALGIWIYFFNGIEQYLSLFHYLNDTYIQVFLEHAKIKLSG